MGQVSKRLRSAAETHRSRSGITRDLLLVATALLMAVTLYLIFFWVPTEQNLGVSQRIFYFHVPLAWLGMVSIVIVAIASFTHLVTGSDKWDSNLGLYPTTH